MDYKKIVSITGFGGLFELLSNKADGAIVRSLEDKQTKFISSRLHNISQIESIEVYTTEGNIRLDELFEAMKNNTEKLPSEKDPSALKNYFHKIYPTIDLSRVYTSDMKKMVKWFQLLQNNNINFSFKKTEQQLQITQEATVDEDKATPSLKEEKSKKTTTKKTNTPKSTQVKEEPVKKTTKKKKAEE